MSMHLGKSICDHFLTMYSNVLHNTTVHSMPLSELSDNFSDHKKSLNHALYRVFVGVKIIRRSVSVPQSYQNLLILQGFQHFLFFSTRFLHGFLNFRTFFPNSLLHIYPRVCYNYSLFYLSAYEKTIVSLLPRRLSYFHL